MKRSRLSFTLFLACLIPIGSSLVHSQTLRRVQRKQPTQQQAPIQAFQAQPAVNGAAPMGLGLAADTFKTQFDDEIKKHFENKNLPGLVVLMARDGMLTYQNTQGHADVENNISLTKDHVFRLASVSKWVSAVLALKMEQDGQINLNSKIKDCIPNLPAHHHQSLVIDTITLRAGIRHYGEPTSPLSPTGWSGNPFETAEQPVKNLMHDPLVAPISMYHYSTMSGCFLARCLELAAGKNCKQLIRDKLSTPYGLSTLRAEDLDQSIPQRVKYYKAVNSKNLADGNQLISNPARIEWKVYGGGMECSAIQLLQLGMKVCDKQILSNSQLERMMKPIDAESSYAMGSNTVVENGNRVIAKSGGQEGVSTYIWMVPDKRMVMVVLANRKEGAGASKLGKKLRIIALGTKKAGSKLPDLIVDQFERTGNPFYANGDLNVPIRYRVRNQGQGGTSVQIVNGIKYGTKWLDSDFMQTLPPSTSKTVEKTIKIKDPNKLLAGRNIDVMAHADAPIAAADTSISPQARVEETSENNNTKSLGFQAPGGITGLAGGTFPTSPASEGPTRLRRPGMKAAPAKAQPAIPNSPQRASSKGPAATQEGSKLDASDAQKIKRPTSPRQKIGKKNSKR